MTATPTSSCTACDRVLPGDELTVSETGARVCVECATYEYAESDLPEWAL